MLATSTPSPHDDLRDSHPHVPPQGGMRECDLPTATSPAKCVDPKQAEQERLLASFGKRQLRWSNIDWTAAIFITAMHIGCLAAPFFFSWSALGAAVVLYWLTTSVGICMGYHRFLSHRAMKLAKPVEFATLAMGTLSAEGTPLTWCAVHRLHHQKSDQEGDPHSPQDGNTWSHILWLLVRREKSELDALHSKYVPELVDQPMMKFFQRTQAAWLIGTAVALIGAGYWLGGLYGAVSFFAWSICLRTVLAYHATWLINSATHRWGYRNYKTRDDSKNLWWAAMFAFGEGWHNNHHAHPSVAPAGHRWWEVDMTWWIIKGLRFVGLAWDVNDRVPESNVPPESNAPPAGIVPPGQASSSSRASDSPSGLLTNR